MALLLRRCLGSPLRKTCWEKAKMAPLMDRAPTRSWTTNLLWFLAWTEAQASVGTPISSMLGLVQLAMALPRAGTFSRREEAKKARVADIVKSLVEVNQANISLV